MSTHFGWIEIVVSAAVALGFGGYQLWSVNREIAKDRAQAEAREKAEAREPAEVRERTGRERDSG
jgi:hypothetical protein